MSYEDDIVAWAEQFKERQLRAGDEIKKVGQGLQAWQGVMDKALWPGYRTIYLMGAQEAAVQSKESIAQLMSEIVRVVCDALDVMNAVPSKIQVGFDYEGCDVDVVIIFRRKANGPEENSPKEDRQVEDKED